MVNIGACFIPFLLRFIDVGLASRNPLEVGVQTHGFHHFFAFEKIHPFFSIIFFEPSSSKSKRDPNNQLVVRVSFMIRSDGYRILMSGFRSSAPKLATQNQKSLPPHKLKWIKNHLTYPMHYDPCEEGGGTSPPEAHPKTPGTVLGHLGFRGKSGWEHRRPTSIGSCPAPLPVPPLHG